MAARFLLDATPHCLKARKGQGDDRPLGKDGSFPTRTVLLGLPSDAKQVRADFKDR